MSSLRRLRRFLRTALLLLLMLGMAAGPALAAVGELHGLEHSAMAAGAAAYAHSHPDGSDHHHSGDDVDPDHTAGAHGFMHHAGGVPETLPEAASGLLMQLPRESRQLEFGKAHRPGDSPKLPFRPPIA